MQELKDKLWRELSEIARKPEFGAGDLELAHKLTDTIKNIDKICMLEDGNSYDGGYSNRHYVRGHYSRDGGSYDGGGRGYDRGGSYDGMYSERRRDSRGRYSRGDGKEEMIEHLSAAMQAGSEEDKEQIRRLMDKLERM